MRIRTWFLWLSRSALSTIAKNRRPSITSSPCGISLNSEMGSVNIKGTPFGDSEPFSESRVSQPGGRESYLRRQLHPWHLRSAADKTFPTIWSQCGDHRNRFCTAQWTHRARHGLERLWPKRGARTFAKCRVYSQQAWITYFPRGSFSRKSLPCLPKHRREPCSRNFITVPSASYTASTPILQRAPSSPATLKAVSAQWKFFRNTLRASTILKAIRTSICSITAIEQSPPLWWSRPSSRRQNGACSPPAFPGDPTPSAWASCGYCHGRITYSISRLSTCWTVPPSWTSNPIPAVWRHAQWLAWWGGRHQGPWGG